MTDRFAYASDEGFIVDLTKPVRCGEPCECEQYEEVTTSELIAHANSLESKLEPFQWRPIKTAPSGYRVLVVVRILDCGSAVLSADYAAGKWWNGANAILDPVTHWMPLPEAPK